MFINAISVRKIVYVNRILYFCVVKPCKLDMYKPSTNSRQASLFWDLETMLDFKHPLFKLANMVDWSLFEKSFAPLFCADNGRPPKPIRLMTGLLMLKHLRNVSDEQVVVQFTENAYYQYFCGLEAFSISAPCASSELVHFRHRIGEKGVELILKESIRINLALEDRKKEEEDRKNRKNGRGRKSDKDQTAFIDSTVQEKNVTFPTDSKLLNKIINYCHKVAKAEGIKVRQSYAREIKGLKLAQRFRGKSHSKKKVAKADRRMRTIAGRLVRELLRVLPSESKYREHLELCLLFSAPSYSKKQTIMKIRWLWGQVLQIWVSHAIFAPCLYVRSPTSQALLVCRLSRKPRPASSVW